jgi:release factor glutamine methyltransferase
MPTIAQALHNAATQLSATSPTPRLDAQVLLADLLGVSRTWLLAEGHLSLGEADHTHFQYLIARRTALEPVAYIVGHKEFYGLDLLVDERVLVPRPETELLVDLALRWCQQQATSSLHIADIGTGSGAIAIALAAHVPHAHIYAVDLSRDALAVAQRNAQRHGVADRIALLHGDGMAPLPQPVDLIASNPPYTVLVDVDENVARWEPHAALDGGGANGWALPARLLHDMPPYLHPNGAVVMEIGAWQGAQAIATAQAVFPNARYTLHKDLARLDRVLQIEQPPHAALPHD